jgi:hypothetical protein
VRRSAGGRVAGGLDVKRVSMRAFGLAGIAGAMLLLAAARRRSRRLDLTGLVAVVTGGAEVSAWPLRVN